MTAYLSVAPKAAGFAVVGKAVVAAAAVGPAIVGGVGIAAGGARDELQPPRLLLAGTVRRRGQHHAVEDAAVALLREKERTELERLPKENSSSGELARSITVDQVRSLQRLFATTPSLSPWRVVWAGQN